jgi:hypothetical protein
MNYHHCPSNMPSNPESSPSSSNNRPPSLSLSDKLFSSVFWSGKCVHSQQEQRPVHFNSAFWQAQRLVEHPTSYKGLHKENPGYEVVEHPDLQLNYNHQELQPWSSIWYWLALGLLPNQTHWSKGWHNWLALIWCMIDLYEIKERQQNVVHACEKA